MKPKAYGAHLPGEPDSPDPPAELVELSRTLESPDARQVGVTCTEAGEWAVFVAVPRGVEVPIGAIEEHCSPYPVVYETAPDEPASPYGG